MYGGYVGEFSLTHLLIVGVVVLVFFGPSRLPALGQSLGKAIRGFKSGLKETDEEVSSNKTDKSAQQLPEISQNLGGTSPSTKSKAEEVIRKDS